jgi:hypothetical protein
MTFNIDNEAAHKVGYAVHGIVAAIRQSRSYAFSLIRISISSFLIFFLPS